MKKVLLDTNAYSRLAGGDESVLDVLAEADVVFVSVFVLGELYAGFKGGKQEKKNDQRHSCSAPRSSSFLPPTRLPTCSRP